MQYNVIYIKIREKWNTLLVQQLQTDFKNARDKINKFYKQHSDKPATLSKLTKNKNLALR